MKYDSLDIDKAMTTAALSLQNTGHIIVLNDPASGLIHAQPAERLSRFTSHPLQVRIEREGPSLIIHFRSRATGEASESAMPCAFFAELDRLIAEAAGTPPERPVTVHAPSEKQREEPPSPPAPVASVSKPLLPPPSPPEPPPPVAPPPSERSVAIVWSGVNLREGPGTNYKVAGQAKKGMSLPVLGEQGGWLRVRFAGEKEVWVSKLATSEGGTKSEPLSTAAVPAQKTKPKKTISPM